MKLTAGDLRGLGNSSLTTLLEGYQTQYDTAEKISLIHFIHICGMS